MNLMFWLVEYIMDIFIYKYGILFIKLNVYLSTKITYWLRLFALFRIINLNCLKSILPHLEPSSISYPCSQPYLEHFNAWFNLMA